MHPPTIIFLHIPKAAGTTLHRIIEQQYRPKEIYSTYPTTFKPDAGIEAFQALPAARRAEIRLLKGHMPFGLHQYIPGPSTYFTLLREPVERVISFYYFVRHNPTHYLYDHVIARGRTLQEYIESQIALSTDNFQLRLLSGVSYHRPYGQCDEELFAQARRNLQEHFTVVGLAERFDETLILLKRTFGWRNIYYIRHNVTRNRPEKEKIPADTLTLIRQANTWDTALYHQAQEQFQAQLQQQDASFAEELRNFQARNRLLQPLLRAYWQARQYSVRAFIHTLQTQLSEIHTRNSHQSKI